jgi:mannose-6-phosphate isomerase-like protein (cupin superfamily)
MKRPWGTWKRLYVDKHVELRELRINAGGFCSAHSHTTKADMISVVQGRLLIQYLSGPDGELAVTGTVELVPNAPVIWMPSFRVHRFWAQTDVIAHELSRADEGHTMDPGEIHRLSEAGKGVPKP